MKGGVLDVSSRGSKNEGRTTVLTIIERLIRAGDTKILNVKHHSGCAASSSPSHRGRWWGECSECSLQKKSLSCRFLKNLRFVSNGIFSFATEPLRTATSRRRGETPCFFSSPPSLSWSLYYQTHSAHAVVANYSYMEARAQTLGRLDVGGKSTHDATTL